MSDARTVQQQHATTPSLRPKWQIYLVGAVRIFFVMVNNLYCIPVHLVWLLFLQPLKLVSSDLYWKIEGIFFRWLLSMVAMWSYSAGYDIVELGDDVWQLSNDRTLVMYNHQTTSDVPLIMAAFNSRPGFSSSVMWIMDRVFRLTNFGIVSLMHGDFFIRAGKAYRDSSLMALRKHLSLFYQPMKRKWIVLFPEGGFLINRKPISQKFGQKLGLPHLENVSLPRSGALKAILDHSAEQGDDDIKWVVDVTVGYEKGDPLNLQSLIAGHRPPCCVVMHYRCYEARNIPRDETSLNTWLYDRYVEKERMLSEYYATGVFPDEPSPTFPAPAPLPPLQPSTHTPKPLLVSAAANKDTKSPEQTQNLGDDKSADLSKHSQEDDDEVPEIHSNSCQLVDALKADNKDTLNAVGLDAKTQCSTYSRNSCSNYPDDLNESSAQSSSGSDSCNKICNASSSKVLDNNSDCNTQPAANKLLLPNDSAAISSLPNGNSGDDETIENNNSPKHSIDQPPHLSPTQSLLRVKREPSDFSSSPDRPSTLSKTKEDSASVPHARCTGLGKLPGAPLNHDPIEFILHHLFYVVSTYVASSALWYTMSSIWQLCC